ncbi:MAG TPA: phage tail tape measure protein [Mycobacterium sp.]
MSTELGAAYLSILPDLSKLGGLVSKGMSAAGSAGSKAFNAAAGKNLGGLSKAFGAAGKDAGEALAKQALAAAKSDIAKLSKQMASATDAQANALGRLRVAQAKLDELRANSKTKASQLAAAEEAVATATRKVNSANTTVTSVTEKLTAAQGKAAEATKQLEKAQDDAAKKAPSAGARLGQGLSDAFKAGFKPQDAETKLNQIDGTKAGRGLATRFGVGFNGVFGGVVSKSAALLAATFATVGIGNLVHDSIDLEASFGQTMSTMAAVAKVPAAEIKSLSDLALKMGADTSFSAGEAADAMLELAKGGLSAATIQSGALQGTLTLAAAGGTDLATASTIASNALNTFNLQGKDMAAVAAALAGGANASSASVESLGEALSQVGPGATNAGLSLQDTVGVLSAFDAAGIKGTDAGTSLKTMLTALVPSTTAASSAMSDLGLKFTDAQGNFLPITNIAEQLRLKLSSLSEEQRTLALSTIFGSDASRAATVLMKEGAAGIGHFIKATKDQNAANEVAASRMSGTAGAIEQFKGSIETAKLQLGQFLAPAVQAGLKRLTDGLNAAVPAARGLADLLVKGDFTHNFAQAFHVAEDSPIVDFLFRLRSAAVSVFGEIRGSVTAFAAAFKAGDGDVTSSGLAGFFERLGLAARNVADGIRNVAPIVAGLAANLARDLLPPAKSLATVLLGLAAVLTGTLGSAFESVTGFLRDNATLTQSVATGVLAMVVAYKAYQGALSLVTLVGKGVLLFTKAWTVAQAALNFVMNANPIGIIALALVGLAAGLVYAYKHSETFRKVVDTVFGAVKGAVLTAVNAMVTAFHAVVGAIGAVVDFVKDHWKTILPLILGPIIGIPLFIALHWEKVKQVFMTGVSAVLGALKTAWGAIVSVLSGPVNAVVGVLQAIWSRVYPILVLPFYIANAAISAVLGLIQKAFTAVGGWVAGVFAKAWAKVSGVLAGPINVALGGIRTAWNAIVAAFNTAKNWVLAGFAKVWAATKATIVGPILLAKSGVVAAWSAITTAFTSAKNWVTGAFAKAWSAVKEKLTGPISAAVGVVKTVLGAGKGGIQWVFSQAVAAIGKIWDGLQELAKKPIRFIISTVLNDGLIDSFNWVANKFQAPTIPRFSLPKGFEDGGHYTGRLPGRASATDNMLGWTPKGAVGLATGEFIVNAQDTARMLPLLEYVNAGGELPTLGFADGGLFGSLKNSLTGAFKAGKSFGSDVLGFLSDPVKWFKDRLAGPLSRMSELGNSPFVQVATAVPRKIVDTVASKAKDLLTGTGSVFNAGLAGALNWAKTQAGRPYLWGGVGPAGYDCSGFMSAIVNVIHGRSPYSRLFATGSLPAGLFAPGPGAFEIGWLTGNPGHVAGTLNGTNVESRGGDGVVVGPRARGAHNALFNQHGHLIGYATGGVIGDPPFDELDPRGKAFKGKAILPRSALSFDSGGLLPTGYSVAYNGTGQPEPVGHDVLRKGDLDGLRIVLDVDGVGRLNAHIDTRAAKVQTRTAASLVHEYDVR